MRPPRYAYAAAKELLARGGRMETGWHVKTLAACEPQKAIFMLRQEGVAVKSKQIRHGVWAYSITTAEDWLRCKKIVHEWERALAVA